MNSDSLLDNKCSNAVCIPWFCDDGRQVQDGDVTYMQNPFWSFVSPLIIFSHGVNFPLKPELQLTSAVLSEPLSATLPGFKVADSLSLQSSAVGHLSKRKEKRKFISERALTHSEFMADI